MAKENAQVTEQTKTLGHNIEYIEYRLDVKPHFRDNVFGAPELHKWTAERNKAIRKGIRIEEFRANQLNAQWHNRKMILLPVGDETENFELIIKP
jgi:hypothetical protein